MAETADPARPRGGPQTAEGKARSARNALRHGLRASRFLLLPHEDPEAFRELVEELRRVHAPADPIERELVDAIAVAMWREGRADRLEAEALADIAPAEAARSCGTDLTGQAARAGLATLVRYRTAAQGEHRRALLLLEQHRRLRRAAHAEAAAREATRPRATAAPEPPASEPLAGEPPPLPERIGLRERARANLELQARIRAKARELAQEQARAAAGPGGPARAA
jgi:hypothetical protein